MLSTEAVEAIFVDCLLDETEIDEQGKPSVEIVKVQGIMNDFGFNPTKLETHRDIIIGFLEELPDSFKESSGGGWSFLNACNDRHGVQWGEHRNMEQLFVLGIAINKAKFIMPREMWVVFPGGMPYVVYLDQR